MLDPGEVITVLTGVAGVTGGFIGGKRLGNSQSIAAAVDTTQLLELAVAELRTQAQAKDGKISDLSSRVDVLESLVTQRAEVEAVHVEVQGVRHVVDRIADKLEA